MSSLYRHKKSQNLYEVLVMSATDCTNERNGTTVVVYVPKEVQLRGLLRKPVLVREYAEFMEKFEKVENNG